MTRLRSAPGQSPRPPHLYGLGGQRNRRPWPLNMFRRGGSPVSALRSEPLARVVRHPVSKHYGWWQRVNRLSSTTLTACPSTSELCAPGGIRTHKLLASKRGAVPFCVRGAGCLDSSALSRILSRLLAAENHHLWGCNPNRTTSTRPLRSAPRIPSVVRLAVQAACRETGRGSHGRCSGRPSQQGRPADA
jgi:hypothetical protein